MRLAHGLLVAALAGTGLGCSHFSHREEAAVATGAYPDGRTKDAMVGWIRDVRGSVIIVDEEVPSVPRRGEIYVQTTTEIVSKTSGMIVPQSWLKRGQRVRVEFRGAANENGMNLSATAQRIVVEM